MLCAHYRLLDAARLMLRDGRHYTFLPLALLICLSAGPHSEYLRKPEGGGVIRRRVGGPVGGQVCAWAGNREMGGPITMQTV